MSVYFIRAGAFGDVKIGHAKDPLARLKQLQTGLPVRLRFLRVVAGGQPEEARLHQQFSAHRKSGEWFAFHRTMLDPIQGCADEAIPSPKRGWWPDISTPKGRYDMAIRDLFAEVWGEEAVARALGVPTRIVSQWAPNYTQIGALVTLARQAGVDVCLIDIVRLQEEAAAAKQVDDRARYDKQQHAERLAWERKFIEERGESAIWWRQMEETKAPPARHPDAPAPQPEPAQAEVGA